MTWVWLPIVVLILVLLALLAYWQLIIAEGAYLGPRVVAKSYDWFARRYDRVKSFVPWTERWFIAGPLMQGLWRVRSPLLLDVATGTGRLPLALLEEGFAGQIVGLDLSLGMLRQACEKLALYTDRVHLVWQDAAHLPFEDGTFDAVTCLEALEFLPRPLEALSEMVRVLAPGGILFLTNRVGREARLLPGRAIPRPQFEQVLAGHPLREVQVRLWQVDYDLVMARKVGRQEAPVARVAGNGDRDLAGMLRCPYCSGAFQGSPGGLTCAECGRVYPFRQGILRLAGSNRAPGV
jgi:ubiquinone/menaquinone biosynthesis C-methylase UbiE